MQYTVMCSRCQPGPKAGTLKIPNASVAPESVAWIPSSRVAGNRAVFLIDLDKGAESQGDANVRSICSRDQAIGQQRWLFAKSMFSVVAGCCLFTATERQY